MNIRLINALKVIQKRAIEIALLAIILPFILQQVFPNNKALSYMTEQPTMYIYFLALSAIFFAIDKIIDKDNKQKTGNK